MNKLKVLVIFGTRPEAIKMAPLVKALEEAPNIHTKVCVTGQHKEMLVQVLKIFNIVPDFNLDVMLKNQTLAGLTAKIITELQQVLCDFKPDLALVHGDTTTALASALACYYQKIDVGHIEAGLRTNNIYSPFPEEGNRQLISKIAKLHFSPTEETRNNLLAEGVKNDDIAVTGNTVIDALSLCLNKLKVNINRMDEIKNNFSDFFNKKYILITGHRRENFGDGFINICDAINDLSKKYPDICFVYPVHLNPAVREVVYKKLSGDNIFLIEPLDYEPFCYLMAHCFIIMTDSGGIQEEAPYLGKPVILMRENTERPEAIQAGTVKLVGNKRENIVNAVSSILDNNEEYVVMQKSHNPYGDGNASKYIIDFIVNKYNLV
ncbi:non-hydrolyzing UDP-N-acetylglucosamine 2-epimerase [Acinetobacter schindleri]|uniref:non-hydrolyzing UDP-N-acetylglucosamine 2-epimerase n=1 Tax=Acinetobacter schindleri TaxID=108981 RepID=UPI0021CD34BB|nr:UDP-N-acetylglucosamine 2-epimerase (non-hydrolyzing) [Acinetobacter schindleri]MCU4323687.1 UDP-N-acetylglucosamine 2-epimerase (non-hydrolyzing) [Acinetobacter schindleri]